MGEAARKQRVTRAEYLAMERAAPTKHDLWDGEVFAMAGARYVHNIVAGNLIAELRNALLGGPCSALPSDMRVRVPGGDRYVYPDVSVACRPVELEDDENDVLLNPRLIAEVLSPSTEAFDRGDKFVGYRQIPSLTDFLFVANRERRVEHYRRQADGTWVLRTSGPGDRVRIESLGAEFAVDALYAGIDPAMGEDEPDAPLVSPGQR
jgi:Uma2 family endonuclease